MSLIIPATATVAAVVTVPSAGESIVTCGGVVSSDTEIVAVAGVPTPLCATTVIVLPPSFRTTGDEKLPDTRATAVPFTLTVAFGSLTEPTTVTGVAFTVLRFKGEVMVITGVAEKLIV